MSLYEQLGRDRGIRAAVDDFYRRVVTDPDLAPYFDGVDMARLRAHQAALLVQVTGGPARYDGRDLAQAHAGLGVSGNHFDRVVGHLASTLTAAGADSGTVQQVGAALMAHRDDVVTEQHSTP